MSAAHSATQLREGLRVNENDLLTWNGIVSHGVIGAAAREVLELFSPASFTDRSGEQRISARAHSAGLRRPTALTTQS